MARLPRPAIHPELEMPRLYASGRRQLQDKFRREKGEMHQSRIGQYQSWYQIIKVTKFIIKVVESRSCESLKVTDSAQVWQST